MKFNLKTTYRPTPPEKCPKNEILSEWHIRTSIPLGCSFLCVWRRHSLVNRVPHPRNPVHIFAADGARSNRYSFRLSHKFRLRRNFTLADAFMRRRAPRGGKARRAQRGTNKEEPVFPAPLCHIKIPAAYNPILPPRGISFRRDACGSSHSVSSIKFLGP